MAEPLEITNKDIEFPVARRESTGLGNGTPVDPSSVSVPILRHSDTFGELCKALAAASLEFAEIEKGTENPYFKSWYADLATLIKATRSPLGKHGLCVVQASQTGKNAVTLTTMLLHSSGEWLANELELPVNKQDAQGNGSAITYARRYAYQSLLNIAGEEDDDGNAAVGKPQQDRKSTSTESGPGRINPVQVRAFWGACKTGNKDVETAEFYLGSLGCENIDELPKSKFDEAIKWALAR